MEVVHAPNIVRRDPRSFERAPVVRRISERVQKEPTKLGILKGSKSVERAPFGAFEFLQMFERRPLSEAALPSGVEKFLKNVSV
jgi:hypothetical protein